jgi:hypothetical protein
LNQATAIFLSKVEQQTIGKLAAAITTAHFTKIEDGTEMDKTGVASTSFETDPRLRATLIANGFYRFVFFSLSFR